MSYNGTFTYQQELTSLGFGSIFKGILAPGVYGYKLAEKGLTQNSVTFKSLYVVLYNDLTDAGTSESVSDSGVRFSLFDVTITYADTPTELVETTDLYFSSTYPLVALRYSYSSSQKAYPKIITVGYAVKSSGSSIHDRRSTDVILFKYGIGNSNFSYEQFDFLWMTKGIAPDSLVIYSDDPNADGISQNGMMSHGLWARTGTNSSGTEHSLSISEGKVLSQKGIVSVGNDGFSIGTASSARNDYIYVSRDGTLVNQVGNGKEYEPFFGRRVVALAENQASKTFVYSSNITNCAYLPSQTVDATTLTVDMVSVSGSTPAVVTSGTSKGINPSSYFTIGHRFSLFSTLSGGANYTVQDTLESLWSAVNTMAGSSSATAGGNWTLTKLRTDLDKEIADRTTNDDIASARWNPMPLTIATALSVPTDVPATTLTSLYMTSDSAYFNYYSTAKGTVSGTTNVYGTATLNSTFRIPSAVATAGAVTAKAGLMSGADKDILDLLNDVVDEEGSVKYQIQKAVTDNNKTYGLTTPSGGGLTIEQRLRNIEMTLFGASPATSVASAQGLTINNLTVTNTLKY